MRRGKAQRYLIFTSQSEKGSYRATRGLECHGEKKHILSPIIKFLESFIKGTQIISCPCQKLEYAGFNKR